MSVLSATIILKTGAEADLPTLASGEPAWTTDTHKLWVGDGATNHEIGAGGGGGTVTSVDLTMPAGFSVSGNPVTGSGTISVTTALSGILKGAAGAITTASAGTDYEVPLTFSTGLTRSTNTVTVNTTQNIAKLSNLTTNGLLKTSGGDGTLSVDTSTYLTTGSAASTYQPLDSTLTALAGYNTNGVICQTAADTFTGRTITGTSGTITVTNGDGVSGNPTLTIDSGYVGQASITTLGTVSTGTWSATTIAVNKGGTGQTSYTDGQLLIGNTSGNTLTKATLTAGTGISVTNGNGSITIAATGGSGTVTSVATGSGLTGGTITTAGTISLDITGLTAADVALGDELPEYNAAATANRKVTVKRVGGFLLGPYAGGRLTLTSGVPLDNNDVTNATTVYYAPYYGNRATIYDGTRWNLYTFSQLSIKLTDAQTCTTTSGSANLTVADSSQLIRGMEVTGTGISGGTTISSITSSTVVVLSANATTSATNTITFKVAASRNVDLFLVDASGSLALRGTIWTGDTTRAVALGDQDGYDCVNNAVIASGDSNSIAAKCGLYVGVVRTTNAGQTEDSYGGGSQSGGKRFVWNRYNRELRHLAVTDTTDNWVYTTDSFRQADGAAGNKVEFVFGCRTQLMQATAVGLAANNTPCYVSLGIGEDSVTVNAAKLVSGLVAGGNPAGIPAALYQGQPAGAGYHYLAWLERSQATGTTAFYGDNAGTVGIKSGLQAWGLF